MKTKLSDGMISAVSLEAPLALAPLSWVALEGIL